MLDDWRIAVRILAEAKIFPSFIACSWAIGTTHRPIHRVLKAVSTDAMWPAREAEHSPTSTAWSCTSTHQCIFMAQGSSTGTTPFRAGVSQERRCSGNAHSTLEFDLSIRPSANCLFDTFKSRRFIAALSALTTATLALLPLSTT
jgi:hypothetical protein